MNPEKLAKLQASVRIGGKGTPRRKKYVAVKSAGTDDKKLQATLKKLQLNQIPAVEEVIFFMEQNVLYFKDPKVQASLPSNTFAITGTPESKSMADILPSLLEQMGSATNFANLQNLLKSRAGAGAAAGGDDGVPNLVENFDEVADSAPGVE